MMELNLTQAEYERFREFILERTGLDFPEDKRHMLNRGLAEVMSQIGCTDSDQLYVMLHSRTAHASLWDQVVSALTVGETYFFRNTSHWDTLRQHILPDLMAQREHSSRRIRIWSAGCATGEEPYSIAILLREMIPNLDSWNIYILATDINREALRKAQDGLYSAWSFRGVERHIQDAYFRLDGRQYVIDDTIKRMVTFSYLNLVGDPYPSLTNNTNAIDVILCRNVTIYFTPQVTTDVVKHLHDSLTDGGWLIPGPSEPNMVYYGDFDTRNFPGTVVYQKAKTLKCQPCVGSAAYVPPFVPQTTVLNTKPIERIRPIKPAVTPRLDPFEVALQLLSDGKLDEALVKLHEKLEQAADFVPTYYTLGKIYANKGSLEEAQAWCERAIQKDRLHAEPYFTLSLVYQEHGLLDQAIDALKRAVYLDREFILAHYHLAQIYQRQDDQLNARRSLQNAHRLLDGKPRDALVPEGDGLMVGRLRELIELELAAP
jgi:chemotaxis protein methyltransferase CheR